MSEYKIVCDSFKSDIEKREYFMSCILRLFPKLHEQMWDHTWPRDVRISSGIQSGYNSYSWMYYDGAHYERCLTPIRDIGYTIEIDLDIDSKEKMLADVTQKLEAIKEIANHTFDSAVYGLEENTSENNFRTLKDYVPTIKANEGKVLMAVSEEVDRICKLSQNMSRIHIIAGKHAFNLIKDMGIQSLYFARIPENIVYVYDYWRALEFPMIPIAYGQAFQRGKILSCPFYWAIAGTGLAVKNKLFISCIEVDEG